MKLHQTEAGITIDLIAGEIPSSIVRDGALYFPVSGQYFRVSAVRISKKYGIIPILDMNITDTPKGGHPVKEGGQEGEQKSLIEY